MSFKAIFVTFVGVAYFLIVTTSGLAQAPQRIAILDFSNSTAVSDEEIDYLAGVLRGAAREVLPERDFLILTRENILDLLPEGRSISDCIGECAVETGRLLSAHYVVAGEAVDFGGQLRLSLTLHDTGDGNLLKTGRVGAPDVLGLELPLEESAAALLNLLTEPALEPIPPVADPTDYRITASPNTANTISAAERIPGFVVEGKTGKRYPSEIYIEGEAFVATGTALREKTFMKINVYTIVSYVSREADFRAETATELVNYTGHKRIEMDLTRGLSRDQLIDSFTDGIKNNYRDISFFKSELDELKDCFVRDAEEGDKVIFIHNPQIGLVVQVNDKICAEIRNVDFMKAVWSIWLGKKPIDQQMKLQLISDYSLNRGLED